MDLTLHPYPSSYATIASLFLTKSLGVESTSAPSILLDMWYLLRSYQDLPFVIAPADLGRLTGGIEDPSRCQGALFCFSVCFAMSSSSLEISAELCRVLWGFVVSELSRRY